ncbi:glycogenin glucosyltransferase [Elasticomyces elasticus]|nr:glycogenin glucosyltransferase [Elasticomyces elasticus]KAK3631560.1 glycogenin glucosyltransferase [Elasticomyces elasticus]KAK4909400.1 glycogenin glucosyltransferase [Elasticomyces elasticus]KAK5749352.1 glycogenin glucosyltransferase [Elasticomyces elasticus]
MADVYATLVLTDSYLPGAAVLAHSLRDTGTQHRLICLYVPTIRPTTIKALAGLYDDLIPVDPVGNPSPANLYLMNRPDLLYTFTKINLWRLTQYRKIVYLDADIVALKAPDELFALQSSFAAAPDVGWPDAFNTGVMVLTPHTGDYNALRTLAAAGDSFDGADQGLLNQYYEHRGWERLSFIYNCTPSGSYQYEPAYRYHKSRVKCVHFIGSQKPWLKGSEKSGSSGGGGVYGELLGRWWAVWERHFPSVSTYEYTSTGRVAPEPTRVAHEPARLTPQAVPKPSFEQDVATEIPFTEHQAPAEAIAQGHTEPTPTVEQRRFSAPHLEWDGTRAAPPSSSKPEAANFPNQQYEFSQSAEPWKAPASYPEIPRKDLWYEVPEQKKEEKLKAIFPWEEREQVRPSRVFAEEEPIVPAPEVKFPSPEDEEEDDFLGGDELTVTADPEPDENEEQRLDHEHSGVTLRKPSAAGWDAFAAGPNKNAWDEVEGIEEYVRALTAFQRNKGNVQVLPVAPDPPQQQQRWQQQQRDAPKDDPADDELNRPEFYERQHHHPTAEQIQRHAQQHVLSPGNEPDPVELVEAVRQRRESLLVTDFPSAWERPSLPVTPAVRRRGTMWGTDVEGSVGHQGFIGEEGWEEAEGVPEQSEWNPDQQLEVLRRNSLVGPGDLKLPNKRKLSSRQMPGTSATIPEEHEPSATHHSLGMDPVLGPLDGTIESQRSPGLMGAAESSGLFNLAENSAEGSESGDVAAEPKAAAAARPTFKEPSFGAATSGDVGSGGVAGEHLSPSQTRDEEVPP